MKSLVCAAVVAGSMFAMAEENAPKAEVAPAKAQAAEVAKPAPHRPQLTPEQRAKMREQREKFMAERKAAMEAKLMEVVRKYVPEEEKAKAFLQELQDAMKASRRPPMRPRPAPKASAVPAAAEQAK